MKYSEFMKGGCRLSDLWPFSRVFRVVGGEALKQGSQTILMPSIMQARSQLSHDYDRYSTQRNDRFPNRSKTRANMLRTLLSCYLALQQWFEIAVNQCACIRTSHYSLVSSCSQNPQLNSHVSVELGRVWPSILVLSNDLRWWWGQEQHLLTIRVARTQDLGSNVLGLS